VASASIPLPTGWQPGDLCLIPASSRSTGALGTAPAGWTDVVANFNSANSTSSHTAVYGRILQAGDTDPTITLSSGRLAAQAIAVQDHGLVSLTDLVSATDPNGATESTSIVAPGLTPADDRSLLLSIHAATESAAGTTWTVTPPAGGTEILDIVSTSGTLTNASLEVATYDLADASAVGARTATATATVSASGVSIAVLAAAAAEPTLRVVRSNLRM